MKKLALLLVATLLSLSLFSQSFVNEEVDIEVCFTANHTYVSDLGFYLIAPGNLDITPGNYGIVQLLPAASDWGPSAAQGSWTGIPWSTLGCLDNSMENTTCQSGDNVENFCFSTDFPASSPDYTPCVCDMETPLTGDFASVEAWDSVYNFPIVGAWGVSIFDCEGIDTGSLLSATITFTMNESGYEFIYQLNPEFEEIINDNSCNLVDASKLFFTPEIPCNLTMDMTHEPADLTFDFYAHREYENQAVPFSVFEPIDSITLNEIVKISETEYRATYLFWQSSRSESSEVFAVYDLGSDPPEHLNLELEVLWQNTETEAFQIVKVNHEAVYNSDIFTNLSAEIAEDVSIYPNLVDDVLYLESHHVNLEYQILNSSGQLICAGNAEEGKTPINLSSVAAGQYFLIMRNEKGVHTEKLQVK